MKSVLLILLRAYKLGVSPYLGQNCRFYPSCSDYAAEALREHGALHGSMLATKRLCKCHPWHPGGLDPVPAAGVKNSSGVASDTASDSSSAAAPGCSHF